MSKRALPDWALIAYTCVVVGLVIGGSQLIATSRLEYGVINGVVFGTLAAVVVVVALRRISTMAPEQAVRVRRTLPLGVLAGALTGGLVMGLLTWLFERT